MFTVGRHESNVPEYGKPRVALDVAQRGWHWAGRAAESDVRDMVEIEVPELPWPLRFYFIRWKDNETIGRSCVGFEIGSPISRADAAELDVDEIDLTMDRQRILWANFSRYRAMAETLLVPTPTNVEAAARSRAAMRRVRGSALDDDFLFGVVAEWRAYHDQPGAMSEMAAARDVNRHTLRRWLERAEERGLFPGEPPPTRHPIARIGRPGNGSEDFGALAGSHPVV